ncbi:ATPase, V1 complex, subunit C [Exidia glandulosa HHB12029]|uniref:V-type proton ATPase subunit C n=1 Tax=Exidia glandulosa HHB12029 TaxID=1314781 RepID=A0A165PDK2_EXIGL|nr:ATPase, V1 complex, subunit C [Exidia glandulosa HHB12029]
MPSDQSSWLVTVPLNGDTEQLNHDIAPKLDALAKGYARESLAQIDVPEFKTGTLDLLISLSEELPKTDTFFTQATAKIVDTIRNLLNNDPQKLAQHVLVNDRPVDAYLLSGWKWNASRYSPQKSAKETIDTLSKEMTSIDNVMKSKLNNYNLAKGSLVQMQRKKTGNLSVRALADVVSKDDFIDDSEYMETVLVAVPKNAVKDWNLKYERLASMVVPRSSKQIATDDEYTLFSAVIFKRVHDEFSQKCRENKFTLRDFTYSEQAVAEQRAELQKADTAEKELWTELLRLARTNFSEAFQLLVHLKVVSAFVESVLRYGLPARYTALIIKPQPKLSSKTLGLLTSHFAYLKPASEKSRKGKETDATEIAGEYQAIMEQEYYDFVLVEIPWIVL